MSVGSWQLQCPKPEVTTGCAASPVAGTDLVQDQEIQRIQTAEFQAHSKLIQCLLKNCCLTEFDFAFFSHLHILHHFAMPRVYGFQLWVDAWANEITSQAGSKTVVQGAASPLKQWAVAVPTTHGVTEREANDANMCGNLCHSKGF